MLFRSVGIVLEWRLQVHNGVAVRAFHETFVLIGVMTACAVLAALRMGGAAAAGKADSS